MKQTTRRDLLRTASALASTLALAVATAVAEPLEDLGLRLDDARAVAANEGPAALQKLAAEVDALSESGWTAERKTAARLLAGEIRFALDEPEAALEHHRRAEKLGQKGPFADDAAFAAIRSLELLGRDDDAAREWGEWLKRHSESPLRTEALLAAGWNAIRRDSLEAAAGFLERLQSEPWMSGDPRAKLAAATLSYLQGRGDAALALLGDSVAGPEAAYLKGLCLEAAGQMLPAAARFQEVVERYPRSPLRDPAMLAKADVFLKSQAHRSAAEEYARVATSAGRDDVRAEAELRGAASLYFDGDPNAAVERLRAIVAARPTSSVAARAQFLLGEVEYSQGAHETAIIEFQRVLSNHFHSDVAARAQYRVGRALDALDRSREATSAYQAVVAGYSQAPEAPAAAYLAGVGLLEQGLPLAAVPYFQLVLDRYAQEGRDGAFAFATDKHRELVEASLCLLELSYWKAGDLAQLSGVPHLMLSKMPPSKSTWRANALLIDADALASQSRFEESQAILEALLRDFPKHPVAIPANRLLAWTYSRRGEDELAIRTEERMLERYASQGDEHLASAFLNKAHIRFNEKDYKAAAAAYDEFARRFPEDENRLLALYQAGLSHQRLEHEGDAVDRWEEIVKTAPTAPIAEKAWIRAGDAYFRAEHYEEAKRCFEGLLANFADSPTVGRGALHVAQCEYNAGRDAEALELFADVIANHPGTPWASQAEEGLEAALYRLGQRADGVEVLAQLVERFPNSPFAADAQFEIARRSYEAEDWAAAAEQFRRVVTQFTTYAAADRAHHLMADSYARAGDKERARDAYEQFLFFFPESPLRPAVQFQLGSLRFDEGDWMRAALDFNATLEGESSAETKQAALYNLAMCQILLEQPEEAAATFQRFRAAQPARDERATDLAYRLGELQERAGRFEEAIARYDEAFASGPSATLATELGFRVGSCHEQLGHEDEAIRFYRKAATSENHADPFHVSACVRLGIIYEGREEPYRALAAYRDVVKNSKDQELVTAAKERVQHISSTLE